MYLSAGDDSGKVPTLYLVIGAVIAGLYFFKRKK